MNRLARLYATAPRVLLVHPRQAVRDELAAALTQRGWHVEPAPRLTAALDAPGRAEDDTVVVGGAEVCERIPGLPPHVPVVVLTDGSVGGSARAGLRAGAFDVAPTHEPGQVRRSVARALWHRGLERALRAPVPEPLEAEGEDPARTLIGSSAAMHRTRTWLRTIARSSGTVIISGETGTGKELAARTLHLHSTRREGPFVAVNCAAIPQHLMESMLFGHTRGAFTDAGSARRGLLQQADGGTLLLDESPCLPLPLQAKLLRALETRVTRPIGAQAEQPFDARILVATQSPLDAEVQAGRFRRDLYYRLAVFELRLPSLRERGADVLELARRFLRRAAERMGKPVRGLTPQAARRLMEHDWPGNVRELQNRIEAAVALAACDHLRPRDFPRLPAELLDDVDGGAPSELFTLEDLEEAYIRYVSEQTAGNKSGAARILGIDRKTVLRHDPGNRAANDRALRWIHAACRRVAIA